MTSLSTSNKQNHKACISCDWLLSLSTASTFIHVVACDRISFHSKADLHSIVCIYHVLLIHSSTGRHWVDSTFLAIVNNAAMHAQMSLWDPAPNSLGYIPRSGITGSQGNAVFNFSEELPYCFPWWLHFTFLPTVHKDSDLSTPSPALTLYFSLSLLLF